MRKAIAIEGNLERGFTVFEVSAAVAIVFVAVALILLAGRTGYRQYSSQRCMERLREVASAYALYSIDNGGFPKTGGLIDGANFQGVKMYRICPLKNHRYRDMVEVAILSAAMRKSSRFPDGEPIPRFDPEGDVLARCLDHGYLGFDRGPSDGFELTPSTTGKVLGVVADTSVVRVAPVSCWEFESVDPAKLPRFERQVKGCHRPVP